jgi:hypothetical protein
MNARKLINRNKRNLKRKKNWIKFEIDNWTRNNLKRERFQYLSISKIVYFRSSQSFDSWCFWCSVSKCTQHRWKRIEKIIFLIEYREWKGDAHSRFSKEYWNFVLLNCLFRTCDLSVVFIQVLYLNLQYIKKIFFRFLMLAMFQKKNFPFSPFSNF